MCANSNHGARGFTLPELMAAVVIVGVLAVMALPAYRYLVASSRNAEAARVLESIRIGQEKYLFMNNQYADVSPALGTPADCSPCYPSQAPDNRKFGWGGWCPTCYIQWYQMPVTVQEPVMFGYSTIARFAGQAPPSLTMRMKQGTSAITWPTSTQVQDYYVMTAVGDTDGDGNRCMVVGSSLSNELIFEADCL